MPQLASHLAPHPDSIQAAVQAALGAKVQRIEVALGEVTLYVAPADYFAAMQALRDDRTCQFTQLVDLCGLDYSTYGDGAYEGPRFAAVSHLLSVNLNQRLRVICFAQDDDFPVLPSVTSLWSSAN